MPKTISFRALLTAAFVAQLLSIPALWGHQSQPAEVLGRYSTRYMFIIILHAVIIVVAFASLFVSRWLEKQLARLPEWAFYSAVFVVTGAALALWGTGIEAHAVAYISLNTLLLVAALVLARPDTPVPAGVRRVLSVSGGGLFVGLLAVAFITTMGMNVFEPDEAHYADIATSFWADGSLYNKSWLSAPVTIEPGLSWFFVVYGGLLEVFGYSVRISRGLGLVGYGLFCAGVYAVGSHLYGRVAGLLAALTAMLSWMLVPQWEYRPSRFVMVVGIWLVYAMLCAREQPHRRLWRHGWVGLLVTLALNIHPIVIVMALALSLFYALEFVWRWGRDGWQALDRVFAFGVGALTGTLAYIGTNVLPAGGFDVYLGNLPASVGASPPPLFYFVRWGSLLEQVLFAAGVAFLVWRRDPTDRMLLALMGLTALAAHLLDSQGYVWHMATFYFLPVGALLVSLGGTAPAHSRRTWIVGGVLLVLLAAQMTTRYIDWGTVRSTLQTGQPPTYLYDELKAVLPQYVREDDVIYSTHQLIWVFPHTSPPTLVSHAAELNAMARFGVDDPVQVWERVQPTVIIFIEDHMHYDAGMQAYLERHPFEVCHQFDVQGHTITISRPDCAIG